MNITADQLAKAYLWETLENDERLPHTPNNPHTMPSISIKHGNEYLDISSWTNRTLSKYIATRRSINYWESRYPVSASNVDTSALQHAAYNTPTWDKHWLSKWHSGICGVRIHLKRWKEQDHSKCPRCQTQGETTQHVLRCQHPSATSLWHTGVEGIEEWLCCNKCIPGLELAIGNRP